LDPAHRRLAVDRQEQDPASILALTREMVALRRRFAALREGDAAVWESPGETLVVSRTAGDEQVLWAVNLGPAEALLEHPSLLQGEVVLSRGAELAGAELRLPGFAVAVIRLEHFQAKWIPVRVKKMLQNKDLERFTDPVRSENALEATKKLADGDSPAS
jgi:hypothetical protein